MERYQTPILSLGSQIEVNNETYKVVGIKGHKHNDIFGNPQLFPVVQLSNGQEIIGATIEEFV